MTSDSSATDQRTKTGENTAGERWRDWLNSYYPDHPSQYARIEIMRPEWAAPYTTSYDAMRPEMNVWGLMWRPAPAVSPDKRQD